MLRYLTAGESHGPALTAIVEGYPAGITLDTGLIDGELKRRQGGYGRGKRQEIETDRVIVESGTYHGVTTGGPITLRLMNKDAKLERLTEPAAPRGGHIDLAGAINYQTGIRQVLERASAERRRCGSPPAVWPSCFLRSWESRCSATCARSGAFPHPLCRWIPRFEIQARSTR